MPMMATPRCLTRRTRYVCSVPSRQSMLSPVVPRVQPLNHLVMLASHGARKRPEEEVVVCSQRLAHRTNLGNANLERLQLTRFNGEDVCSLRDLARKLVAALNPNPTKFLVFEFQPGGLLVAIDAHAAKRATLEVCTANAIPAPVCPSLGVDASLLIPEKAAH